MHILALRAESVNSLHLRRHTVKHMKAAIQGPGSMHHYAAPATKVSYAQIVNFAKFYPFPDIQLSCRLRRTTAAGRAESASLLTLMTLELKRGNFWYATRKHNKKGNSMTQRLPTVEESFYFQSVALAESISGLSRSEQNGFTEIPTLPTLLNGTFSKGMRAKQLPVFGGQGSLLACLYLLAVLPFEWQDKKHKNLSEIDLKDARKVACDVAQNPRRTGYPLDSCVLKHLRNSIAHGRVGFGEGNKFIFSDEYKGKTFSAEMTMDGAGKLVQALCEAATKYFISQLGK